ncbi:MAG: CXXX repeat peptide maturase [Muribaculaceae bacterium]|nr:CXXX repeat peptide maturase [Muribaculaceae bacterium]
MLKYLIVQLDDAAPSFCHYPSSDFGSSLMDIEVLRDALRWSMKENLTVQFIYPDYKLPEDYLVLIDSVYHADIVSSENSDEALRSEADVIICDSWEALTAYPLQKKQAYVLRVRIDDFLKHSSLLKKVVPLVDRLNVVFTDVEKYDDSVNPRYAEVLKEIGHYIREEYKRNHAVQINLLTDRIFLDEMNNCNAGSESVTLCPDGNFYLCPAYNKDLTRTVGNMTEGLNIRNPQLLRINHAPICMKCDAWQCRRCLWMNKMMTLEFNTPSHQQCVMAHIERNASKSLLDDLKTAGVLNTHKEISEIDYLDPFDKINI